MVSISVEAAVRSAVDFYIIFPLNISLLLFLVLFCEFHLLMDRALWAGPWQPI
jgi:hypothetical protein